MSYDAMPELKTCKAIYIADALIMMSGGKGQITIEHSDKFKITLALEGKSPCSAEGNTLFGAIKNLAEETGYCPLKGDSSF